MLLRYGDFGITHFLLSTEYDFNFRYFSISLVEKLIYVIVLPLQPRL